MLEFKQNTQIRVPVRVLTPFGVPVPSVTNAGVTITVEKADGTTVAFAPSGAQWIEVTAGAYFGQGKYDLIIPSSFTDQAGPLSIAVGVSGANTFVGMFKLIAFESSDLSSSISTSQADFDAWKVDWTTSRANKVDNLSVNVNTLATASALTTVSTAVGAVQAQTTLLLSYTRGTWTIFDTGPDANKIVFYDESNVVIAKMNLQDDAGNPVSNNPFSRVRIPGSGYGA